MSESFSKLYFFKFFPWDLRCTRRALALAGLAFAIAFVLTAATDEGDVPWLLRLGRTWPALPVCAAVGTWGALASGRARMERIALETLGRSPQKNLAGYVAAGALVSLFAGAALAGCPSLDLQAYYPTVARGGTFVFDGHDFIDPARGLRVTPDGATTPIPRDGAPTALDASRSPRARAIAAAVTALTGIALALLAAGISNATPRARLRLAGTVLLALLLTIFAFHAVAAEGSAGGLTLLAATLPACALLAYATSSYRRNPGESARPS